MLAQANLFDFIQDLYNNSESFEDFVIMLSARKEDLGLSWNDIADYVMAIANVEHDESYYRKKYKKYLLEREDEVESKEESYSRDVEAPESTDSSSLYNQLLELKKERVKLSDERTQNNAYIRRLSREDTLREIAHEAVKQISAKHPLLLSDKIFVETRRNANEAILCLSDWHYGIEFENAWNAYNPTIAKKRIEALLQKTITTAKANHISKIHVLNLADMIAGRIHLTIRLESRIDVITQIMQVSEILAEFLNVLSEFFDVEYYSCLDNHSRIEPIKADSLDLESLCRITDWYLKERLEINNRIHFNENRFGYDIITFTCKGFHILGIHGHKDKPSSVIESISAMTGASYDLICMAHRHHFSADEQTGTLLVCNGSLMGTDTFATNLRLWSKPSQNLIIVSDDNVAEAIYRIVL